MKTRIENLKKEAREIQQMLLNDWMDEANAARATQLIADVNRMKYIEAKCNEILKRAEKVATPIEKEAEKEAEKEVTEETKGTFEEGMDQSTPTGEEKKKK